MKKILLLLFSITLIFFLASGVTNAENYDVYVNKNYTENYANGSSDKPYATIKKALDKLGSKGGKIYIKNGTYDETITLKNNTDLFGQNRDKTIIRGTIVSEGGNKVKNLTISGKSYGISALGKIEITNCKIKNSSKIGIDLSESSKEASISDSIISGNRKGIYVQRKRSISFFGNSVYGNTEEGIDIREKVNGTIAKNEVFENGEGGIEIIIGGSNVKISGNSIKKNKASGIAAQFYSFIEKTGSIDIINNTISRNGHFGFTCGIPSGGSPSELYWNESINLKENTMEGNKKNAVNDICNIIRVVDKEEEKENKITDIASKLEVAEEKENEETKENIIKEQLAEQKEANDFLISSSDQNLKILKDQNRFSAVFFGISNSKLTSVKNTVREIESQLSNLKNILQETKNTENQYLANEIIGNLEKELEKNINFVQKKESQFSLLGWLRKLF